MAEAMSILSLANICFKTCIVKTPARIGELEPMSSKTAGVLEYLEVPKNEQEKWLLSEKETVCVHNCSKSYIELKGFLHEQLLKDFTFVRKKNRNLFENL